MLTARVHGCLLFLFVFASSAFGQQAGSARPVGDPKSVAGQDQSLADVARKLRDKKPVEVKMSGEDAKELFRSVDTNFTFAAEDTGFPRHSTVKRQLVGQADVEKFTRERLAKAESTQYFSRTELTMKKFGFLPRDFNMSEFLVKSNAQRIAGYYDEEKKSISLLNWVPLERQRPILAHELTHALQDQNYDLKKWIKAGQPASQSADKKEGASEVEDRESTIARRAVVEGQAMVVYVDYLLSAFGRNMQNTPGVLSWIEDPAVTAVIDSELLHDAPMVLRETGTFPYREGLIFEGELLEKGGKRMAFAGAFARPPRNTHEVLQPKAYIDGEKLQSVHIPDVRQVLADKYEVYDSGGIGELDVRALLKQYGERKIANDLSSAWQGGAYVAFRRAGKEAASSARTADLALLYVSRWKTSKAAESFAAIYAAAVQKRYPSATIKPAAPCSGTLCPISATQASTEEGPVIVEQWPDNTVIVSESFDTTTAAKLRDAVRHSDPEMHAAEMHAEDMQQRELNFRLYDLPAFRAFQADLGERIVHTLEQRARQR